ERLERRARLAASARRGVERAVEVVAAADERDEIPGLRIDGDERRFEATDVEMAKAGCDRALGRVLHVGPERGLDLPVGWMVAAELAAELLAEKFLRPCGPALGRLAIGLDSRADATRVVLLRRRDEALLAHPLKDDVTAIERAFVVRPG